MSSEVDRILAESRKSVSLARRAGAIIYGLVLTLGVLFTLRSEFVEKFDIPLLYSLDTRDATYTVSYSVDKGSTWKTPLQSASTPSALEVPLAEATAEVAVRVAIELPRPVADASEGTAAPDKKAEGPELSQEDIAKLTAIKKIPSFVSYRADAAKTWKSGTKLTADPLTYSIKNVSGTLLVRTARPASASVAIAWVVCLLLTAPIGLFIAWVVLRLGYMKNAFTISTMLFFTLFGLTMIVPFLWMISTGLKSAQDAQLFRIQWLPWPMRIKNFSEVFSVVPFGRFYINSVFLASYVTIGQMFTSALAAYSFARLDFPGRDKLFFGYLATMMIPGAVTTIPIFVLMCKLGWVDSYKAIIIPGIFSAWGTFMLRQFFMTLPRDLEDAAKIDGCSLFGIFTRIIVPLSKPALATFTIFTFMGSWGDFMWPLIILNDPKKMPLPVGIQFFSVSEYPDANVLMAATMMMIIPVMIVFIAGQRYFVEGIQLGAVKG